jgi:hypothetical protein
MNTTSKKENKFYVSEKSIASALKIAKLSGSGLRTITANNKGIYPIEFKKDGTKSVIRYITSKVFSDNIKTGKAIPASDFIKAFSDYRSGEKAIELVRIVSKIIGREYGNLNRLYSEFNSKVSKGLIVSFRPEIEKEKIGEYLKI